MRIDGRKIRDEIKKDLRREVSLLKNPPRLAVISVGRNIVVQGFVKMKRQFANDIGVIFLEEILSENVSFSEIKNIIEKYNREPLIGGVIVQLPLPNHLNTEDVLNLISRYKDVDILSGEANEIFKKGESLIMPPVVSAIVEIFRREHIEIFENKKIVVLGHGRLVGAPMAIWFRHKNADIVVVDGPTVNLGAILQDADIVVSGTGVAGIIKPEMIKKGAVLIDAGTSESGGVIVGDADPRCEDTASVFTPVPGGIGPIAVAMIFRNLMLLGKR